MAEGVVDRLEAVEIKEHDRAGDIAGCRRAKRLAKKLADAPAVRKTRKHVDVGEMGQALLRLPNFGDIGSDAAKSFKAAGGVDDRVAGDRNPASAARRLQLHFERIERLLLEQHAAKFGMSAEKSRKRMANQLTGGLAQQRAHSGANIADAVLVIDLPQPAHTPLLILLEKEACAFALTSDVGIGFELMEGPASDGENAEDRDAEREDDRQHVLERDRIAAD